MIINRLRDAASSRLVRITAIFFTVLCIAFSTWGPDVSTAGKEGVFINNSVYFTLENAALSKGSDNQMIQFQIRLNNDGDSAVDFNYYGVKVTSLSGGSYYAQLSKQAEAQVAAHSAADYYYVSTVPGGLDASGLKVTVFERNGSNLRDIGSLSVANVQSAGAQEHQLLINLSDADSSLTANSFVSFQALKAVALPQDGKWTVLVDTTVTPTGSEAVTLPSGIHYLLHDGQGRLLSLSSNAVEGTTINAGQTKHLLLSATLDTLPSADALTLDLALDGAGIQSLGKLSLAPLFQLANTGEKVPYVLHGREGVTLELQRAEEQQVSGKKGALVTAVIHNDGKSTLKSPELQGILISQADTLSVSADLAGTPESYVAPGESGIYRFAVQLPEGASAEQLQFLISEKPGDSNNTSTSQKSGTSAAETAAGSTGSSTSASSGTTAAAGSTSTTNTSSSGGTQSSTDAASVTNVIPVLAAHLQEGLAAGSNFNNISQYVLGQPFVFDSGSSQIIDPDLQVSVVELNGHTNADNGYQTVVAKFKFLNKSNETLKLPAFDTALTDASGTSYPGARQTTSLQELIPNAAYVYSYSYMLPPSATGAFKLSILDTSNASSIKVPIADYKVNVAVTGEEEPHAAVKELSLYPFQVKMDYWTINAQYNSGTYTYKLKADIDIQKLEDVIVDDSFSTLEFELVDAANRVLGSTTGQLQGTGKLISGLQTINFTDIASEQLVDPVTIRIYENITTSSGSARRLLATLTQ